MEQFDLEDMRLRRKQQMVLLMEATDLTKQLLEAADRRDQVSVQMLLSMRQEPVMRLQELESGIQQRLRELPEAEAIHLNDLLYGGEPDNEGEKPLCEQVRQYRRSLEALVELDKRLSLKINGRQSFYNKFRD